VIKTLFSVCFAALTFVPVVSEAASSRQCGQASWYGPGFEGRRTANGERFSPYALTAAHRSLPFGSRVRVTNQANGRSVVLRINDHGPVYSDRIIDLSRTAFAGIASTGQGLARVCIARA